jgi:hypothetical protein
MKSWVQDKKVVGVRARLDLEACFKLNYVQDMILDIEEVRSAIGELSRER